jgi:hypothetical protein
MKVNLHIERLILAGVPIEQRQGPELQAVVQRQLTQLLADRGATPQFNGHTLASVTGGSIQVAERADPAGLGEQIAAAVDRGLRERP